MSVAAQILEPETEVRAAMRAIGAASARGGARARQRAGGAEEPCADGRRAGLARTLGRHSRRQRERSRRRPRRRACRRLPRPARAQSRPHRGDRARPRGGRRACPIRSGGCSRLSPGPTASSSSGSRRRSASSGVIYESRPNVTADAGALCLKSGNAVVLRGGSDSLHSSAAIHACLVAGLEEAGLPEAAISRAPFASRDAVGEMLQGLGGTLDVIVPRGGKSLVERVQREARVPVFAHLEGVVHVYVDRAADLDKAVQHRRQRQDAPHRRLRRRRDAARPPRRGAAPCCSRWSRR